MAGEPLLRPSVFDRLMAHEFEGPASRHLHTVGLLDLCRAVERDLRWLLESRCALGSELPDFPHASQSILTYGLPDLSIYAWAHEEGKRSIARMIEQAIQRFEPRLTRVTVTPLTERRDEEFRLVFRIEALLEAHPIQAPVCFDVDVEADGSHLSVRSRGDA